MTAYLALLVIASVVTRGYQSALPAPRALVEITLADVFVTHMTNDLIGRAISIRKSFMDTLESCHVVFPNGATYEGYPNDNIPTGIGISYQFSVQPFTACAVGFLGADVSRSGTYELISVVQHIAEDYRSSTRQRFHMTLLARPDY